jgi:hypothetical protein
LNHNSAENCLSCWFKVWITELDRKRQIHELDPQATSPPYQLTWTPKRYNFRKGLLGHCAVAIGVLSPKRTGNWGLYQFSSHPTRAVWTVKIQNSPQQWTIK